MLFGCATTTPDPTGTSYANDLLKRDVRREIKVIENSCTLLGQKGIPSLGSPQVVNYQATTAPTTSTDPWEEIWSIQRKGYVVKYKIKFTPTPEQGGCDMAISTMFKGTDYQ